MGESRSSTKPTPTEPVPRAAWDEESQPTESEDVLDDGDVVDHRFLIAEKMQSGSFGQVYLALDKQRKDLEVALKVEKPRPKGKRSFCAHEAEVMQRCQGQKHIPELFAYSTSPPVMYIAMQLMSFTLTELRRSCPSKLVGRFSGSTTIRLAVQSLTAVRQLHHVGVVHRDIKPSNFMMGGSQSTKRCVYLLDFGLSRFFRKLNGDAIPPRERPGFVGSTRYASPNAHDGKELGRGDDLMSLLYVFVEMRTGRLPWRNVGDRYVVGSVKKSTPFKKLCSDLPPEMVKFGQKIQPLTYEDEPPYDELEDLLKKIVDDGKFAKDEPYDWEENFVKVLREDSSDANKKQSNGGTTSE